MARLSLNNISKSFGQTEVLKGISLDIEDGEFLSLVGQSGCGKSTLLRIISGLEAPDSGTILIDGVDVTDASPKHRNIAMVFQDYALYPHMSVAENMSMPLLMGQLPLGARLPLVRRISPAARRAKPQIAAHVEKVATQLGIAHLLARKPAQLSGGQRQRVALGRALVRDPGLFLMDEPLSNLDAKLRVQVRKEITELHASSGLTFVYVTHDQTEAMTMSDRVALMQAGKVLQAASPNTLYSNPANIDVARFIGSPEINLIPIENRLEGVFLGERRLPFEITGKTGAYQLGIRPEAFGLVGQSQFLPNQHAEAADLRLMLRVRMVEDLGPEVLLHGAFDVEPNAEIRVRAQKNTHFKSLDRLKNTAGVELAVDLGASLIFGADGARVNARRTTADAKTLSKTNGAAQ